MTEQITQVIVSIIPSIIAILTMVGVVIRTVGQFRDLKKQVTDMKDVEELKDQMKEVLQENCELKRAFRQTMTKIDHVRRD